MCIIHFECPPFDVFFSSFQTAIIFYIKRSFYYVITSLTLSLNHATITWFSTYKKSPIISGFSQETSILSPLFGPPGGIRTPDLQNRNLLRYPASPRAEDIILCYQLLPGMSTIEIKCRE